RQYLEFYKDLGITSLYRQTAGIPVTAAQRDSKPAPTTSRPGKAADPPASGMTSAIPTLPVMQPSDESLLQILEDIGDCKRCRLSEGRQKIVFGVGNERAPLVFVGEGPGADEDEQGIPFVGRAGQLLTQMIEATAKKEGIPLKRSEVYICNVVKCR